jgi:VanZ family protein
MLKKPFTLAVMCAIIIFVLSVMPAESFPKVESWWDLIEEDKLVHLAMYGTLAALILRGYVQKKQPITTMVLLGIFVGCSAYGWLLEIIQGTFCTDRLFEKTDGVANMIGAALVLPTYNIFFKPKNTK